LVSNRRGLEPKILNEIQPIAGTRLFFCAYTAMLLEPFIWLTVLRNVYASREGGITRILLPPFQVMLAWFSDFVKICSTYLRE
jgi:hypothetical protein